MEIINLIHTYVVLHNKNGKDIVITPEPNELYVRENVEIVDNVDGITLVRVSYDTSGLPPQKEGVIYIVSKYVYEVHKERNDLYFPTHPVYNEHNIIKHFKYLSQYK